MTRLHIPITLRWSDLDAYGHVNNAEMLRLLEEARIVAFWSTGDGLPERDPDAGTAILDGTPSAKTQSLIARQEIEYLRPIPYFRLPLDIELWIGYLGGASLEVCYEVHTPIGIEHRELLTRAVTTLVMVDSVSSKPTRITAEQRLAWEPYIEETLTFRRRR